MVRSSSAASSPEGLFSIVTDTLSPWPRRSTSRLAVNVAAFACSGFGGPVGLPSLVMNAKLSSSTPPTLCWQARFSVCPVTGFW